MNNNATQQRPDASSLATPQRNSLVTQRPGNEQGQQGNGKGHNV
jgi:hypothetical protein